MFTIATTAEAKCLFANVASKRDVRWYLQGILIEATETSTHIVATNGHALAELDQGTEHNPELAAAVSHWCGLTGKPNLIIKPWKLATGRDGKQDILLSFDGPRVFAHQGSTQTLLDTSPSDGQYPAWRRVSVAQKENREPITLLGIQPMYLAPFAPTTASDGIRLTCPGGENSAVRVQCSGGLARITGTVMPIRT
jgi:hypothetical protein